MRRHSWMALAAAAAVALAGRGLGGDPATEREKFQGTWAVVSLEKDGKVEKLPAGRKPTMTFTGDKFQMRGGEADYGGTFTLDPTRRPRRIDTAVTQGENKTVRTQGIYEMQGDTLTIVWTEGDGPRPAALAGKAAPGTRKVVLKRQ